MTEVGLFLLIGAVSIAAAVMMLLSQNAVHSALFLILIMVCIAFMFLMLNAPFLAMIQITVYAGAIMVLFLFVIMLLGAEKLGGQPARFRWMTPVAMFLALLFLITAGVAIGQGQIDLDAAPPTQPMVRVAHMAAEVGAVDVYANNELVASGLSYPNATDFLTFAPGEYNLALFEAGTQNALLASTVTLETGFTGSVIAYGLDAPQIAVVADDLSTVAERSGRVTVFNGYSEAVSLMDFASDFNDDDDRVVLDTLEPGTTSEALVLPEDTDLRAWAVVEAGNPGNVLFRLNNPDLFAIERDTSQLLVVKADPRLADFVRASVVPLATPAAASFGGPLQMGQLLFTRYMLPMQMVAVLLLVAMIGAIVLTHKPAEATSIERRAAGRRRVSRPLTSVIAAQTGHDVTTEANGSAAELPEAVEEEPMRN